MKPHGLLLTGGGSTRMHRAKATIPVGDTTLAERGAALLGEVCELAVEVGPGLSGLPAVGEESPGSGPLAAVAAGYEALVARAGEKRPAIVLACDLPTVTEDLLAWLARYPDVHTWDSSSGALVSVVPVVDGKSQPLCARWSVTDLERAASRWAGGERSLRGVFGPDALYPDEDVWGSVAGAWAFEDVDTPEDLARQGIAPPVNRDDWVAMSRNGLDARAAGEWVSLRSCGAVVVFSGTVRDHAEGREGVEELEYSAYEEPAIRRMKIIVGEARRRWPQLGRVAALHRLGRLAVGETAVVVAVSSPHRPGAFAAASFVIDTVKESVPIWKYERWKDGEGWGTCAHEIHDPA